MSEPEMPKAQRYVIGEQKPAIKIGLTPQVKPIGQNTPLDLVTNGSIEGTSFQLLQGKPKRRLIISVEGREKTGKTSFALTAPGPIGFQDIDIGTEGVIERFGSEKEIHIAEYSLSFPFEQKVAEKSWQQFRNDYKALLGSIKVRSAIIDNAVEVWDLLRIAKFGRMTQIMPHLYGVVNSEFKELMRLAYHSDTNLVLIHKVKKQYVNDAWNGKYERAGFGDMGYLVQVVTETYTETHVDKESGKTTEKYFLKVLECRQNGKIKGLVIENPTFSKLGVAVFPDTTEADWK